MTSENREPEEADLERQAQGIDPLPQLSRSIELVHLIRQGDPDACNELLTRYRPRLLRIVRVKLGRGLQQRLDEEDVVQEALLVAAERFETFELRSHAGILHWLVGIAENVIRKRREHHLAEKRNAGRELRVHSGSQETTPGIDLTADDPTPSQNASRSELEELVDSYVEALDPPDYREVILQRDYYQADWEDVCSALGRPGVEAVQQLYRRAHQRLRERLKKHLDRS